MSITSDIRSYADTAVAEGRKVLDTTLATAQVQLQNVSAVANKAGEAVHDVRTSAEKAINADALRAAVAPYVAQAKGYQGAPRSTFGLQHRHCASHPTDSSVAIHTCEARRTPQRSFPTYSRSP